MKIFYAVQVSNFTDRNGSPRWLLRNDACTNIMIGIVSTTLDLKPDWKFLIKLPHPNSTEDVTNLYELFDKKYHKNVEFYIENVPVSPVTSRFNFDFNSHTSDVSHGKLSDVDVMINDENTLTKNWRVLFEYLKLDIPIVSTNYFMDSPISSKITNIKTRYYERQMESLISSDMFSFPVKSALDEAMKAYDFFFKDNSILAKPTVWHVGAHYAEIKSGKTIDRDIRTIYFGNRISESAGRYTNWHIFASAIGELNKRTDIPEFRAIMLNPTRKCTPEILKEINERSGGKVEVMKNEDKFTREDYRKFINSADITCNLFTNEVHGGLTHIEGMMAENILVAPNVNDYKYKFDNENIKYPFLVDATEKEIMLDDFVNKLAEALKMCRSSQGNYWKETCRDLAIKYESFENSAPKIIEDLEYLYTLKKNKVKA